VRSSKPPALATWLVEHAIPGEKNEALAGDLLEQFSQGRSTGWYWRQVLAAIAVGFSRELRILCVAASFTLFWVSVLAVSRQSLIHFSGGRLFQAVLGREVTLAWPVSVIAPITVIAALNAVPLLVSLTTYLLLRRSFTSRRLLQGIAVGLAGVELGYFGGMLLPSRTLASAFMAYSMPLFLALSISLWTVRPSKLGRCAKSRPAQSAHSS
jgi:hypothetical protein